MGDLICLFVLLVWLIPGIVGGGITALAIKWADKKLDRRNFAIIVSGWAVGMMIGGVAGVVFYVLTDYDVLNERLAWIIGISITGMITAFIGSLTTHMALESLTTNKNAG